ncbi:RecF/RecN/SMC protein [Dictyocaulus viviparus]|uniref:RecF/RecN/SMC protein n=1 Tax=Dictyocaulus viviparus TaxID=29172 RepID=A0A0D8X6P5_DICVI|nr:RecF/RecN/SMC protein [Dictyocaulus viviparus]
MNKLLQLGKRSAGTIFKSSGVVLWRREIVLVISMYIKRLEIDGFKSYSKLQIIDGFDTQFNAITDPYEYVHINTVYSAYLESKGLNGTGKSNILDSICFVLGITNLTHIRAGQLHDLVYKQGQAGINKATVSITFDNRDKKHGPIGYHHCDEITIKRQILGMIEEAAGTKLYEAKRTLALNTINKKQSKVDEIEKIVSEENALFTLSTKSLHDSNVKQYECHWDAITLEVIGYCVVHDLGGNTTYGKRSLNTRRGQSRQFNFSRLFNSKIFLPEAFTKKEGVLLGLPEKKKLLMSSKDVMSPNDFVNEKLMVEDILPQLEKLQRDKQNFLEYNNCDREIERQERKLIAFTYYMSLSDVVVCHVQLNAEECEKIALEKAEEIKLLVKELEEIEAVLEQQQSDLTNVEDAKKKRYAEAFSALEANVAKELAKIEACDEEKRECKESFGEILTEYEEKRKSLDNEIKQMKKKEADLIKWEKEIGSKEQAFKFAEEPTLTKLDRMNT